MSSRWPFAGDSVTVRARKIAWAYRAVIEEAAADNPALLLKLSELDERFRSWDESWIAPKKTFSMDDWVTATEAGSILGVSGGAVSVLRVKGRIKGRRDGKRFLYLVADVWSLSDRPRRRTQPATDRVHANGRSVSDE